MAQHNDTGKKGEAMARAFLETAGFQIEAINWRYRRSEIDIIAKEGKVLVFVEVKTRSYDYYGKPEVFVSDYQQRLLAKAAAAYMEMTAHEWEIRFDVIAILLPENEAPEIRHLRDAFFPGL